MAGQPGNESSVTIRMKVREFAMPPVRDALVLGKDSPIGCAAMRRALAILQPTVFEHIELAPDDDVLSDILVRASVLKKIQRDKLVAFVLQRIKPLMQSDECLHIELETELLFEEQL